MKDESLIGKVVLMSVGNKAVIGRACSYDGWRGKYRCVRLSCGSQPILRKSEFLVPFDKMLKKYNKFMGGQNEK